MSSRIDQATRKRLRDRGRAERYAAGDLLCRAGEEADSFHLVESGWLAVQVSLADGETSTVNVLGPGDYFGELSLLREEPRRTATVVALEDAVTVVVPAAAFRAALADTPVLAHAIALLLADRVDALSQRVVEASYADLDTRVRRRLAELAERRSRIPITQTVFAQVVGGSRPAVNRVLRHLVDEGAIRLGRGVIEVVTPEGLRPDRSG